MKKLVNLRNKSALNFKTIRGRILFGFSFIVALIIVYGGYTTFNSTQISNESKDIAEFQLPLLIADEALAFNISERIGLTRAYVLNGNEEYKQQFEQLTEESEVLQQEALGLSDSEVFTELVGKSDSWEQAVYQFVFNEYDAGNIEVAQQNLETVIKPVADEVIVGFKELINQREQQIEAAAGDLNQQSQTSIVVGAILTIVVAILSIVIALFVSVIISKPIKRVSERMNQMAAGDLSGEPLGIKSKDEVGQLVDATNQMNRNIRDLLSEISVVSGTVSGQSEELTQASNEVKEGGTQIASTMQQLSSGAETQASTTNDLQSSMSNFIDKIYDANENGEMVHQSSKQVLALTQNGSQLMKSSIDQMSAIDRIVKDAVDKVKGLDQQSQEVTKLVSVIKDIAEQTNLLALNAAIEAARAGEHGKGFAVVADEVRKLAEQVSISVTDITQIVQNIQTETGAVTASLQGGYTEVENGMNQVVTTGETFEEINGSLSEMAAGVRQISENLATIAGNSDAINESIEEIASVSEESAAGIEQTAASVQQTSSSMDEIASSSNQLAKSAENLNDLVARFKL
ncbi:methyl-accepting chemotaxis protein [Aquibacillus koreensis]|uniref:Methyl-accepting chemotaxis protein n=1 Tax=Aquibacillus koreensis TaxID=279446 RepID=A0A9X4AI64_9BACI|nr:methyl-accepting chemotaxis protein [Aquibacillus koreensis]MCT2535958.1 methyl-accepting chemotaxis protein [Aquibacillus koreensis]MDC3420414.1 methyl-accepting chemotaxis protein [Aquibacillus koreensis]